MKCRHCNTDLSEVFIDMGVHPPSNSFLSPEQLKEPEARFPLCVYVCSNCFLVQIDELKKTEEIFDQDYVYFSSFSSSWLNHARLYTEMAIDRFKLDSESIVVEVASNDGYLLQYMKENNIPCYGIEPSLATADAAREKGIDSINEFFGVELAKRIVADRGRVDLLIGNNVLAHVPDINDFIKGIEILVNDGGVATLEFPHLMRLVDECQFDTIYHEHFSYLSLGTVSRMFASVGLRVFDVEELPTHGGSLRVFACHDDNPVSTTDAVMELLAREESKGLKSLEYYASFQEKADRVKEGLLDFLKEQKANGKRVAAYGAAAKGNTLLNYCDIEEGLIEFCVDASPHKQGLFMPGTHIPVLAPEALKEKQPDYVLILPWNIKKEIMSQHNYIESWGGKFVIAIPALEIK